MKIALALVAFFVSCTAAAFSLEGRVVGVSDGDTITVLTPENRQIRVRFAGIDAPEKSQDFGQVSKKALSNMVYGRNVSLECVGQSYDRQICSVFVDGQDVGYQQIANGNAWWYRAYAKSQGPVMAAKYGAAELRARHAKVGLWSQPGAVEPWNYRHNK